MNYNFLKSLCNNMGWDFHCQSEYQTDEQGFSYYKCAIRIEAGGTGYSTLIDEKYADDKTVRQLFDEQAVMLLTRVIKAQPKPNYNLA